MDKLVIYLADLTHTRDVLSSNVFPLSVGLIAAHLKHTAADPDAYEIELFKYPDDLASALEARRPDIVAFANYSWNLHLSYAFATEIKAADPDITVVFGGPNYGLADDEVAAFWATHPLIDFYIVKEGEAAFAQLIEAFVGNDGSPSALKAARTELPNCHYMVSGSLVSGPELPRMKFEDLASPYLMGLMDKFFDGRLIPMIQTTRGCPFSCTFCAEGAGYFDKVEQRLDGLRDELDYIATHVQPRKHVHDIYLTDANFGMYKQDLAKAEVFAECQRRHGYPRSIYVSTGKNQKERVVEVAKRLDGALNLLASLQSTDEAVLENVSRSNISLDKLADVSLQANRADAMTTSEIILGLPGDSVAAHLKSVHDAVDAGFDNIRMYQFIALPQTEANSTENREKFRMRPMHRIIPRSFGMYEVYGRHFHAVESEEIVVASSTMSFDEYVHCREIDLTVEILHNGRVYGEMQKLCRSLELSWFEFIVRVHAERENHGPEFLGLYEYFGQQMTSRLWPYRRDLDAFIAADAEAVRDDALGANEISNTKAMAFFQRFDALNRAVYACMRDWLAELGRLDTELDDILASLERLSYLQKSGLIDPAVEFVEAFPLDLDRLGAGEVESPGALRLIRPKRYRFAHRPEQRDWIDGYKAEYGESLDGLGRMLMRHPRIDRIFRNIEPLH